MSRLILAFFFLLIFTLTKAQNSITGRLQDADDKSQIISANISLLNTDSTFYKGALSDTAGKFKIENAANGNYILKISSLGFSDQFRSINELNASLDLENILLKQSGKLLKSIVIEDKAPTAVQKGDTTQYNANSYKTHPDANAEDLITKMSGVTAIDGKVQAHGEEVKKVLVDGKPFFGDDPNAVLKNLPADVIDKIQVFDQQSEQSKFTGINDGNTTKTINIITKQGMRNGTFGKVYAGYGYDNVYKAAFNINFLKGDRRIYIISQSNNINEQNFSADDLAGVMAQSAGAKKDGHGGPGGMGGASGTNGSSNNFLVNAKNGISTTHAAGINYSDKWMKKVDVNASYFFNWSDNNTEQVISRLYILPASSSQTYKENSTSSARNINHRFNLKLEDKIDSSNTITITPKFSLQLNSGKNNIDGLNAINNTPLTQTNTFYSSETKAFSLSNELLFQHKLKKPGRTFSVNIPASYNTANSVNNTYSKNYYYSDSASFTELLDQQSILTKLGKNIGSTFIYTEPFAKKSILQISYGNSFNFTSNNKQTFNYSLINDDYNNRDTALSNVFKSEYITHKAGLAYRYNNLKLQFMAGANYELASLKADQIFPYTFRLEKNYWRILPSAMLRYNFTLKKSLRIMYRTQTNPPAIDQLQNVVNNSNPALLSTGNPDLKQNYENSMFMRYASSNTDKASSFFAMIGGTITKNYISNSTFIAEKDTVRNDVFLRKGTQLTQPVNLNGYVNARSFITYGIPVKILKSNLNVNVNAAYIKTPGMINDKINFSYSQTYGAGLSLSSNISKEIDFTLSSGLSYNTVENSVSANSNTKYYSLNSKVKLNYIFLKNIVFNTELNHFYYKGLSAGFDQNYFLWNAAAGYKFLEAKNAEIRISCVDILKQNTSIIRNTTETYTEDVRTNLLQRYFMLTFIYNIKVFKQPTDKTETH